MYWQRNSALLAFYVLFWIDVGTATPPSNIGNIWPLNRHPRFSLSNFQPLSRNLIKDDRLRRSPDNFTVNFSDVGRFKSSPPQELATKVELDPRLDFRPLIVDDDDLDDSSERKAIFIRRIDDFKDRTHQRRKHRPLLSRPLIRLFDTRNFLIGSRKTNDSSTFPSLTDTLQNSVVKPKSKLQTVLHGKEIIHQINKPSINQPKQQMSLLKIASIEQDDIIFDKERNRFRLDSVENITPLILEAPPDTVYGLRIPKENSSVHHAASTRVKIPMKIPAPERSVNSQLFTIETNEVDDLGHVLHQSDEEDMSNELISFFQNLRPTTAKPPVKIVVSSETNATHMSINIPRKIVQRHPAIVSNFVRSFINQKPQPVDEYDFYSRNYNIGANKAELPYERSGTSHGQDRRPFKTNSFQNYFKSRTEKLSSVLGHSTLKSHFGVYDDVPSVVPIMNAAKEMDKDSNINQAKNNKERYRPAKYEFSYEISEDDVQMGHQEARSGHRVDGEYHVLLPNGLRQIVTYYADETGYHPTIRYDPPIKLSPRKVLSIPQTDDLSRGALAITASSSASPTATNMAAEAVPLASQNFNTGNSLHSISFPDEEVIRKSEFHRRLARENFVPSPSFSEVESSPPPKINFLVQKNNERSLMNENLNGQPPHSKLNTDYNKIADILQHLPSSGHYSKSLENKYAAENQPSTRHAPMIQEISVKIGNNSRIPFWDGVRPSELTDFFIESSKMVGQHPALKIPPTAREQKYPYSGAQNVSESDSKVASKFIPSRQLRASYFPKL